MTKTTKREKFLTIVEILTNAGETDLANCIAQEIELLDNKAAKAKAKAAEKKAANDELTDVVAAVLTDEFQTIADITAQIEVPDTTIHKVTNRLTRLVAANVAVKESISVPTADGKTKNVMGYKLAD